MTESYPSSSQLPAIKIQPRVLMVAAEASSALYALRLLEHWRREKLNVSAFGVGDSQMHSIGFDCFGRAEEMAVMGFVEVFKHYSHIKAVYLKILEEVKKNPPPFAVLLDYPGFNLKLAEELYKLNIPVVYYVSPQVWAWKKKRVYKIEKFVNKMLVVFPFELDFYKNYKVPVEFVGHPLLDELKPEWLDANSILSQRSRMGISPQAKVLGLMPGSRTGEIDYMLPTQIQVARDLYQKIPNLCVMVLVAPTLSKEQMADRLGELKIPYILIKDDPFKMIRLTDAILAASGTATLMVGLLEKPMVIMYKVNWLTAWIGRKLVPGFFGIVNIIMKREVVPEVFQSQANPQVLGPLVEKALCDSVYRETVIQDLKLLKTQLGEKGVTAKVAASLMSFFKKS